MSCKLCFTERKGHDGLVDNDCDEDGHEFSKLLLKSDSQAFKERVKGQGHDEENSPEGRVVEDVRAVAVLVLEIKTSHVD